MIERIVYLAGGMTGLSLEEQSLWRIKMTGNLFTELRANDKTSRHITVVDPTEYYDISEDGDYTEKEAMLFDLDKVRKSDLIIMNYNAPLSLGSMAELAIGWEHRIPIIGLNEDNKGLHPWQIEMTTKMFNNTEDLTQYAVKYYLS